MKKILIPTDFSDNAWDALTYAIRLYDDIPCIFYILNTYEVNPSGIPNTMHQFAARKVAKILRQESKDKLNEILTHLRNNMLNDKHEYKGISKHGSLVSTVKNIVEEEHIDMIVMGTTGATGLKEVFMGSNAVKVIKEIDLCPILSVPAKYVYEELEQVIFATDFRKNLDKHALKSIVELQQIYNCKIRFVHINNERQLSEIQEYNREAVKTYFDDTFISFEEIRGEATLSKVITVFAAKEKAHLICLAKYEHSFIEKLLHEPIVKRVAFHTSIPLLILPV